MSTANTAACKRVALDDLPAARGQRCVECTARARQGTILLASEGAQVALADTRSGVDACLRQVRADIRFADIVARQSLPVTAPFRHRCIRLKQGIIPLRRATTRPADSGAPTVAATVLRRWMPRAHDDDGRKSTSPDTRYGRDTPLGGFADAITCPPVRFGKFPAASAVDRARHAGKIVVAFCPGGIHCKKRPLHRRKPGLRHVQRFDGGLSGCPECTGGSGWHGDGFVGDQHVALPAGLAPLATAEPAPTDNARVPTRHDGCVRP